MVIARVDRARDTEDALSAVLIKLTNQIKNSPNYPNNTIELKRLYNTLVYTATRKAIETTYQDGVNYVGRKTSIDTYTTDTDTANVKTQTDEAVARFWGIINNDANRDLGNEVQTKFVGGPEKPSFDTNYWMGSIALLSMTKALSSGTVSKGKQIVDQIKYNNPEDPEDTGIGIDSEDDDRPKFVFTWHTAGDERVCEEFDGEEGCAPKDDQEWFNDDPDIPEPPLHDGCRCWLDMELLEFDVKDISKFNPKK